LNYPVDKGLLWLQDDSLLSSDLHNNTETYPYVEDERSRSGYTLPPVAFDTSDYKYHTFAIELLPHEVRFLMDSNVVRRIPDHLIPTNSPAYNWASKIMRSPVNIHPSEEDIDYDPTDPFGEHPGTSTYIERQYFESHLANPGFWDVTIGGHTYHAAHHLVDYIKIWDVPADVKISGYPQ
jgi:hypothetical protein